MDRESWALSLKTLKPEMVVFDQSVLFSYCSGDGKLLGAEGKARVQETVRYRAWVMIIVKVI